MVKVRARSKGWVAVALLVAVAAVGAVVAAPTVARAFCGFYVGGADAKLFNNATMVVLMRDGTRTVLSMQNNYQGPPSDFAMVVPVPVVLQQENVKTLPRELFDRVDTLAAPRLVEYWEMDPCATDEPEFSGSVDLMAAPRSSAKMAGGGGLVRVEAQFTVGEYEIVILSADDALALEQWIRGNGYKIPDGAEAVLRPYVAAGMKFFVAKVDADKVKRDGDKTLLSPLRFHYDSEKFELPVRLGMLNSSGTQDLIVHVLATQRYEVANYKNVFIPTNHAIAEEAKERFGEFYAALFDATMAKTPGAVVTEYAWQATSCDPCPGGQMGSSGLTADALMTLGGDVVPAGQNPFAFVLTRLHTRYAKDALGDDLVFRAAGPIAGGREAYGASGRLEEGAMVAQSNNFQGRYAIRHAWRGKAACANPVFGRWGGPSGGAAPAPTAARDLAFAPRGVIDLAAMVMHDIAEIGVVARTKTAGVAAGAKTFGRSAGSGNDDSDGLLETGLLIATLGLCVVFLLLRKQLRKQRGPDGS